MALIIFLLIIAAPVIELSVLIDVGGEIGAIQTVALCLLTAAVGLSLVRMQGMKVLQDMQQKAQIGEPIGNDLVHGVFLLLAGIFLFIPGFITDFLGALLLIPFVRLALGKAGMAHTVARGASFGRGPFGHSGTSQGGGFHSKTTIIIDGEFSADEKPEAKDDDDVKTPEIEIIPPKKDR